MLVPDLNATDDWRKKLTLFDDSGIKATLFESFEQMSTDEQREQSLDIADFLIAKQTPHGILEQMMQRNPALRQLVDALQLELVGIEEYKSSESTLKSEEMAQSKSQSSSSETGMSNKYNFSENGKYYNPEVLNR